MNKKIEFINLWSERAQKLSIKCQEAVEGKSSSDAARTATSTSSCVLEFGFVFEHLRSPGENSYVLYNFTDCCKKGEQSKQKFLVNFKWGTFHESQILRAAVKITLSRWLTSSDRTCQLSSWSRTRNRNSHLFCLITPSNEVALKCSSTIWRRRKLIWGSIASAWQTLLLRR